MSVEAPAPGSAPALPERAALPVAAQPPPPAAAASASDAAVPRCENCGASVPGRYCGSCGQRLEPPVHSLGHFVGVAAEDLTHADSRLWRTLLALLTKPGMLTREFLAGRRASYLPPVRLYLVVSVVFFLWAALHASKDQNSIIMVQPDTPTAAHAAPPSAAPSSAAPPSAAPPSAAPRSAAPPSARPLNVNVKDSASAADCAELAAGITYNGPRADQIRTLARQSCEKMVKDNGRSVSEAVMHNLPRAMFVFLPLLAAVMMLFYWRPRRYYVEHLLFLLHNHAFVFVFLILTWAVALPFPPVAALIWTASSLYMLWYVYRAMRAVYGQGRGLTIAKMLAMSFVYLIFGALMLTITAVYSAITA
jgi:hypothetical protein